MKKMWIFWAFLIFSFLFLSFCYCCAFVALRRIKQNENSATTFPSTPQYLPYINQIKKKIEYNKSLPFKEYRIKSNDRKTLFARYYEAENKKAPLVIFFHGYRSSPFRDSGGAFDFFNENGYSLLLVSQRSHEKSNGLFLTMGIKERLDCKAWVDFAAENFKEAEKIILCGVSMGAATVLMAAGENLNERVKGIIADSSFSSVKEIMGCVIKRLKLPVKLTYFFIKTGAALFAGVNLDSVCVKEQLKKTKIPILFIHGQDDKFVPFEMTQLSFNEYQGEKYIFSVANAGHGMSYFVDTPGYKRAVSEFFEKI